MAHTPSKTTEVWRMRGARTLACRVGTRADASASAPLCRKVERFANARKHVALGNTTGVPLIDRGSQPGEFHFVFPVVGPGSITFLAYLCVATIISRKVPEVNSGRFPGSGGFEPGLTSS